MIKKLVEEALEITVAYFNKKKNKEQMMNYIIDPITNEISSKLSKYLFILFVMYLIVLILIIYILFTLITKKPE